jgi:hypothetical protein
MNENDIVYRLRKRAEIRRQIPNRKSVQEGQPDRIADLLEEAAGEIERLRSPRGQYAERNSNLSNWEHEIDLHLAQTIYNVQGIGKLEFTFDIINFANMLNKKWGASYSSAYNLSPLTMTGLSTDADGNKIASFSYNKAEIQKSDISSRWHCQVGVRLTF